MSAYEYFRPRTIEEALRLLSEREGSRLVAGGTDLLVNLRRKRVKPPPALISLRNVQELRGLEGGPLLRIRAATTISEAIEDEGFRKGHAALFEAARLLGNPQIRNVATFGGNLCNASPAANLAPPLLAAEARLEIRGAKGVREVPAESFIVCPGGCCLGPGEIATAILVPAPGPGSRSIFLRRSRVLMDLATASVAVMIEADGKNIRKARVAAGAVAPTPVRLRAVEALLEGNAVTKGLLEKVQAEAAAGVKPISDVRAGAEYRRHLIGVFVRRAVEALMGA